MRRCGHRFVEAAPTFLQMNKAQLSFYSGYITIQHASLDQHAPPRGSIESLYPRLVAALLDEGQLGIFFARYARIIIHFAAGCRV